MTSTNRKPRPASINEVVTALKAARAETQASIAQVSNQTQQARRSADWLAERARKGTPGLTRAIARLTADVAQHEKLLRNLQQRLDDTPTDGNLAQLQSSLGEVEAIKGQLALIEPLDQKVGNLRTELDALSSTVAGHGVRLEAVENCVDSLSDYHNNLAGSHRRLTGRVFTLENIQTKFPTGAVVAGIVIGLLTTYLWWKFFRHAEVTTLPDGSVATTPLVAARNYGAWLVGVAAGCLTVAIGMFVGRRKPSQQYTSASTAEVPIVHHPYPSVHQDADANVAPTRVYPPTQGVTNGARKD